MMPNERSLVLWTGMPLIPTENFYLNELYRRGSKLPYSSQRIFFDSSHTVRFPSQSLCNHRNFKKNLAIVIRRKMSMTKYIFGRNTYALHSSCTRFLCVVSSPLDSLGSNYIRSNIRHKRNLSNVAKYQCAHEESNLRLLIFFCCYSLTLCSLQFLRKEFSRFSYLDLSLFYAKFFSRYFEKIDRPPIISFI